MWEIEIEGRHFIVSEFILLILKGLWDSNKIFTYLFEHGDPVVFSAMIYTLDQDLVFI